MGSGEKDVSRRLTDINEFVKASEERITKIQKRLNSSNLESSAYAILVDALRDEVQLQVERLAKLNEQIDTYKREYDGLEVLMKLNENEVNEVRQQTSVKEKELLLL